MPRPNYGENAANPTREVVASQIFLPLTHPLYGRPEYSEIRISEIVCGPHIVLFLYRSLVGDREYVFRQAVQGFGVTPLTSHEVGPIATARDGVRAFTAAMCLVRDTYPILRAYEVAPENPPHHAQKEQSCPK